MLNYNVLNDFVEKLKNAGITIDEIKAVAKAYSDGDIQHTLTAGDGIIISDDNIISASSVTNHLYRHIILLTTSLSSISDYVLLNLYTSDNTPFTFDSIKDYLISYRTGSGYSYEIEPATGYHNSSVVNGISAYLDDSTIKLIAHYGSSEGSISSLNQIKDTIIEIF